MECSSRFDDIRPYRDDEIHAAMQRIVSDRLFPKLASYVYPGVSPGDAAARLLACDCIYDFLLLFRSADFSPYSNKKKLVSIGSVLGKHSMADH